MAREHDIHREAEKRNQYSFVCILFNAWRNPVNFFTYTKEGIGYNIVYLIFWHALRILRNNEMETISPIRKRKFLNKFCVIHDALCVGYSLPLLRQ